jgi:hypothetical protein
MNRRRLTDFRLALTGKPLLAPIKIAPLACRYLAPSFQNMQVYDFKGIYKK